MEKIKLTKQELIDIINVAVCNVKDFVMDNDKFIEDQLVAINYIHCCETLKDKKTITFDLWCKIKNIHHSFDDYYLWDKTLIEKEHVLRMYKSFTENL